MNASKLNEWLQIAASLGVLIGLLVVAYEIRQNTTVAQAEHSRAIYSLWVDLSGVELDTGVAEALITAIENQGQLTAADKFKLNSWLTAVVSVYDYTTLESNLGASLIQSTIDEEDARYYFASEYARDWFEFNKRWINPATSEVISRAIEELPTAKTYDEASGLYSDSEIR